MCDLGSQSQPGSALTGGRDLSTFFGNSRIRGRPCFHEHRAYCSAGVLSISCADKFNPLSNRHTPDFEYRMPLIIVVYKVDRLTRSLWTSPNWSSCSTRMMSPSSR